MFKQFAFSLAALGVAASPLAVQAQSTWPTQPITMVVPFPPGGSTDVIARLFAVKLGERLKQPVVIENKPGANTGIGAQAVARAKPDGYTVMITGAPTFTSNSLLYANLGYDPIGSYDYIAIAGSAPFVILTNTQTGLASVSDIVRESAKQPLNFGSFGTASTPHLAGESLAQRSGAKLVHIPYRGSAPAMTDLIGNQIPLSIDTLVAALPQIRGGKVKAVALTSAEPSTLLPGVPTVASSDARLTGYDFQTWYGIAAPKGTPKPVRERLTREVQDMMAEADTQVKMRELGFDPSFAGADAFKARVEQELKRNGAVIKEANIKVD